MGGFKGINSNFWVATFFTLFVVTLCQGKTSFLLHQHFLGIDFALICLVFMSFSMISYQDQCPRDKNKLLSSTVRFDEYKKVDQGLKGTYAKRTVRF